MNYNVFGQNNIFFDNKFSQKTRNFYQNYTFSKSYYKPKEQKGRSFTRGKEKSESNLINKYNMNSYRYYKSPYHRDESLMNYSNFNNSAYSFYTSLNNQINNIKKIINTKYNYNTSRMPRINTEKDNNMALQVRINRKKNSKILINENSSNSSEENRSSNINDNNNLNNNNYIVKKDPIHIVNNFDYDNDYKKLLEKIREKKLVQNKEKEKINNIYNINVDNINNLSDDIDILNEKQLQSINNEILLNSNSNLFNKRKNNRDIKENILSFSQKYIDNTEQLYSNSTILNRKKDYFIDNNLIKKEYNTEKDEEYRQNYRRLKRSNEGIMIPRESLYHNIIKKGKINESYSKDINNNSSSSIKIIYPVNRGEKFGYNNDINQKDIKELNQRRTNNNNEDINNIYDNKKYIKNDFKYDNLSKEQIQSFSINTLIYQSNLDKDNYKILPGMSFGIMPPGKHLNKIEKNENISINNNKQYNIKNNNYNNNNKYNKNMGVTKNNFEIIDMNINYKNEKDKILEKLLLENNDLKGKIINKENEIQQLNMDKNMYKDFDISKYQQMIKELDSKIKDNKNIKGQLNILKSQKSNLYKDYNKYKDISDTLKKENEKLLKEKDEYKKERDKLSNEIKILKINANHNNNISNIKINVSKNISKPKLLKDNNSNNNSNSVKKYKKKISSKKYHTLENESIINSKSKDPLVMTNNTNNKYKTINIVKNDNFCFLGNSNYKIKNYSNNYNNIMNNIVINNINNSRNILLEKMVSNKNKQISIFKEQIKSLNNLLKDIKELKNIKEVKRTSKSAPKKKKANNNDNNTSKSNNEENNKKYIDEINELKNNIKKLENEKISLNYKIGNLENKKNNKEQLMKQIEDLKNQINYSNNQIKSLKSKNNELDDFFVTAKSFIKIIKPSNEKETNLYLKLKNHIDFLEKEKNVK